MTITWEQILAFLCEDQTMAITSLLFLAFFAAVALINYALPRVLRPYFLLLASYGFFCYDPVNRPLVWVMAAATLITWLCGLIIGKVRCKPVRILALLASVGFGIGILVYYKYWNLLADSLGGSLLSRRENLLAPLGLSYFTFAAMSYTIDVYKRRCRVETNPLHYALFVSFFPTLINGPIERYPQLRPQIRKSRRFSYQRCAGGAFRMLWGYTKKMVLADNLRQYVAAVYGDISAVGGPNLTVATVLFAVQLYMDFSGCCDIALGAARILGYDLIENFESPFEARTFNDFWRRWHISMTSWFRDYVYFSLGGSRCAPWRHYLNIVIVFVLPEPAHRLYAHRPVARRGLAVSGMGPCHRPVRCLRRDDGQGAQKSESLQPALPHGLVQGTVADDYHGRAVLPDAGLFCFGHLQHRPICGLWLAAAGLGRFSWIVGAGVGADLQQRH